MPKVFACVAIALSPLTATAALAQKVAPPLSRTVVEAQIKAGFARGDLNHDGSISLAESDSARMAAMAAQFGAAFSAMDANKDGALSREEYVAANQKGMVAAMQKQGVSAKAFAAGDLNHDGKIVLAEAMAGTLKQFDAIDTNHDGTLSVAERQAAAKRQ